MKVKNLLAASVFLLSGAAFADSYQAEIAGIAARIDADNSKGTLDVYSLGGKYYFEAVDTDNLPLSEAAFLSKNGGVYGAASHSSLFGKSFDVYSLAADYFIPDAFLYFDVSAMRTKYGAFTDDEWSTTLGVTPIDGLLISTEYNHDQGYDANLSAKYVTATRAGEFINIEANIVDRGDEIEGTYTEIGVDYYFDRTFSLGGEVESEDSDNSYTIRMQKFFTEQFSAALSYTDGVDENRVFLAAGFRF